MNTAERITALEQKLAETQAELKALKAGPDVPIKPPRPADPDLPRPLVTLIEERSSFVRPTLDELRKLYGIVCNKYPQFRPRPSARWADQEKQEYFDGFIWSFERLGHIGRTIAPATRHYVDFWSSECRDWLRLHRPGFSGNIGAGLLAAVVAHGDIPFIVGDERQGVVWSVGVTTFG
jgi:hypothetical protein